MIHIYRLINFLYFSTILPFQLIFSSRARQFIKYRLKNKIDEINIEPRDNVYMIHASSGEAEYAFPLIEELKKNEPDCKIVLTYYSVSYVEHLKKHSSIDYLLALPLDLPGPCRQFLKKFSPKTIFIARTDLWPEFLNQAQKLKIQTILFSRTQKESSVFLKLINRWLYSYITAVSAVSETDKKNLSSFYDPDMIYVHGDTRWKQVEQKLIDLPSYTFQKANFICGSIWPEDFEKVIKYWDKSFGQLTLVPHEEDQSFIKKIKSYFEMQGLNVLFFSKINIKDQKIPECDVLIVDVFGHLSRFYKNSYGAFIGGSFKKKVHSVMESLASKTPVVIGPYYKNNREAITYKDHVVDSSIALNAVNVVQDKEGFLAVLKKMHSSKLTSFDFITDQQASASEIYKQFIIKKSS